RRSHRRTELVDQRTDWLFGLFIRDRAAACFGELAEQPQHQQGLVRDPLLTNQCSPQPRQPTKQLVATHAFPSPEPQTIHQGALTAMYCHLISSPERPR